MSRLKLKVSYSMLKKILMMIPVFMFGIIILYPLAQALMIAIKPIEEFTLNPTGFPHVIRLQNFIDAWKKGDFELLLFNTVLVTVLQTVLVIILASPVGYALAKMNMKGKGFFNYYFLLGMMIPFQSIMLPLLKVSTVLHVNNSLAILVIFYTASSLPLPILIFRSFYKSIPDEIIDAAKMDGCKPFRLFKDVIFPLTKPVNLTVAIMVSKGPWHDFFVPLVFILDKTKKTLAIGLYNFQTAYSNDWTLTFAMVLMMSAPLVIFFLFTQRTFIKGAIEGAIR